MVEGYGQNSTDDSKLRSISCLIEGAVHNILLHYDDAHNVSYFLFYKLNLIIWFFFIYIIIQCYQEALARVDDSKLNFTRYVSPFATCELGILEYVQNDVNMRDFISKRFIDFHLTFSRILNKLKNC